MSIPFPVRVIIGLGLIACAVIHDVSIHIHHDLQLDRGAGPVPLALTRRDLEFSQAAQPGARFVATIPAGTAVVYVDHGVLASQVEVSEGPYYGTRGWVPSEWVTAK